MGRGGKEDENKNPERKYQDEYPTLTLPRQSTKSFVLSYGT